MKTALAVRPVDVVRADPARYGRMLRRALWTDEALALLPGDYGWNDGGCLLLADALCSLLGADARLIAVVGNGTLTGQHFAVQVSVRFENWYLDADGAARHDTLVRRWERVERVRGARLTPAANATLCPGTPRDAGVSERIARFVWRRTTVAREPRRKSV